jgi:type VI protein secretion system component VasK
MNPSPSPLEITLGRLGATGLQRDRRYQVPWLMVVGEPGSGRTSLVAGASLRRPYGSPTRKEMEAGGWGVWLFDQGVVLDMPGMTDKPTEEWQAVLRRLRLIRSQRPIDGLVLTIPATLLTGPEALDEVGLERKAQKLFEGMQSLRQELGVRVPISIVITWADIIHGFPAFCRTLPPRMRDEMLGWSSPYSPQEPYLPAWVDEAFHSTFQALCRMQQELFADGQGTAADREDAFLFPGALQALARPVRRLLDVLFQSTPYTQPALLRGIYFCGDPEAEGAVEPRGSAASGPRSPAFVTHLLERKAFPESGLAGPDTEATRSNRRKVTVLKGSLAACVLLAVLALGGVWWTSFHAGGVAPQRSSAPWAERPASGQPPTPPEPQQPPKVSNPQPPPEAPPRRSPNPPRDPSWPETGSKQKPQQRLVWDDAPPPPPARTKKPASPSGWKDSPPPQRAEARASEGY